LKSLIRSRASRLSGHILLVLGLGVLVLAGLAPAGSAAAECPNDAFRTSRSAQLPDCRAYELVTPADAGRNLSYPYASSNQIRFPFQFSTPDGNTLAWASHEGDFLPGGNGIKETYASVRTSNGWEVARRLSPSAFYTGDEFEPPDGSYDGSLEYSFWTLPFEGTVANYRVGPGGTPEFIGKGSLGVDPLAAGRWISPGATQIVFSTLGTDGAGPLEPNSPSSGFAVYERSLAGPSDVVSILPDGLTAEEGRYEGISANGRSIAFAANGQLFVRMDGDRTVEVTQPGVQFEFAGLSSTGTQIFYVSEGNIYTMDLQTSSATQIISTGNAEPTVISSDGSHVYFVSTSIIGPSSGPAAGENNLYLWERSTGQVQFIATVAQQDVVPGNRGLGSWVFAQQAAVVAPALVNARTNPDGDVLAFTSHARLTSYDNEGFAEVYLYDVDTHQMYCPSCDPDGASPMGDAQLQNPFLSETVAINNLTDNGEEVFFETPDPLVGSDIDGEKDIYKWSAAKGPALISSGESFPSAGEGNELISVTPDGSNVFFSTAQSLAGGAPEGIIAIYDARVDGGFADEASTSCSGESCQPSPVASPAPPTVSSQQVNGHGNVPSARKKGKRDTKTKRMTKNICVRQKSGHVHRITGVNARRPNCKGRKKASNHSHGRSGR
jgi:Tol biopolymer transport system component